MRWKIMNVMCCRLISVVLLKSSVGSAIVSRVYKWVWSPLLDVVVWNIVTISLQNFQLGPKMCSVGLGDLLPPKSNLFILESKWELVQNLRKHYAVSNIEAQTNRYSKYSICLLLPMVYSSLFSDAFKINDSFIHREHNLQINLDNSNC